MTHCDECNEPLVRTPSGYCCPNGHGRIVPAQKANARSKAEELAGLPKGHEIEGVMSTQRCFAGAQHYTTRARYSLVDADDKLLEGIWGIINGQVPHAVRAMCNGTRRWFVRDTLIEREVRRALGIEQPEYEGAK